MYLIVVKENSTLLNIPYQAINKLFYIWVIRTISNSISLVKRFTEILFTFTRFIIKLIGQNFYMTGSLEMRNGRPVVRLRTFRAIDEPDTCEKFKLGHKQVLINFGIEMITSAKDEWTNNPDVFVFIVESLDKSKIYGGARIHVAGGFQPLPIEDATGILDPSVYKLVKDIGRYGTGEGCGLWNSREIAGYGIGSIFLSRAGVVIAAQLGIKSLLALCAPYTVSLAERIGYRIEKHLGNQGTFYYPRLDLIATSMVNYDLENLSTASEEDKNSIIYLRNNPNAVKTEILRKKEIEIHYEIEIPNLQQWSLKRAIEHLGNSNFSPIPNPRSESPFT